MSGPGPGPLSFQALLIYSILLYSTLKPLPLFVFLSVCHYILPLHIWYEHLKFKSTSLFIPLHLCCFSDRYTFSIHIRLYFDFIIFLMHKYSSRLWYICIKCELQALEIDNCDDVKLMNIFCN